MLGGGFMISGQSATPARPKPKRFILASKIRPGDILLTSESWFPKSNREVVWGLRAATLSRFTHAAVFMTRLGLLETASPDECSELTIKPVVKDSRGRLLIALDDEIAVVLRPRPRAVGQANSDPERFSKTIASAVLAYLGREYPQIGALETAALRPFRGVAAQLLRKYGGTGRQPALFERWFCSGLVARAYEDAGLPLADKPPEEISPGTISRSEKLQRVSGAIIRRRESETYEEVLGPAVITGSLDAATLEALVLKAERVARSGDMRLALKQLAGDLTRLIGAPEAALLALEEREKQLEEAGSL
jgi:hypothetical protein